MRYVPVILATALVLTTTACAPSNPIAIEPPATTTSAATSSPAATTPPAPPADKTTAPTVAAKPKPVPIAAQPSAKSLAYARQIGGTSHKGDTLYFIIGESMESEAEAQAALKRAIPLFGDMQSYFIVQRSDNFDGMKPGWWVVIESYRESPSAENRQFAKRAFKDAYVKRATVLTGDPIPVYEDLVPQ